MSNPKGPTSRRGGNLEWMPKMPVLTYNDTDHIYCIDDVIFPSVTQTLETAGIIQPYTGDPWYGERGTAVHAATWLDDQGILDEETLDPQIVGFVEAWRKYRRESGFAPIGGETPMCHPLHRYAGTPDRWDAHLLADIKTGKEAAWHILQRAAYRELLKRAGVKIKRDCCVYLSADGRYTTSKTPSTTNDLSVFLSALTCNQWKESPGNDTRSKRRSS